MDIGAVLGKIGFDPSTFIVTIINFLIVFFVLRKFVFTKLMDTIENRQAIIQKGLEDAEKAGHELSMAEQKANEIIEESKVEANKIVAESKDEAVKVSELERSSTEKELQRIREEADKRIEEDRSKMIDEIKKDAADLAILATEKIIENKLDSEEDKKLINSYLDNLGEVDEK